MILQAVNSINDFYLILCKVSWCSVLCRLFHVYNNVNPADLPNERSDYMPQLILASIYASVQKMETEWYEGNEREALIPSDIPVMLSRNWPGDPLPFRQEHLRHPAFVFQKSVRIVYFRLILLGDIIFLICHPKKKVKARE